MEDDTDVLRGQNGLPRMLPSRDQFRSPFEYDDVFYDFFDALLPVAHE